MTYLDELENKSIYLIREAHYRFKDAALLWSMGKDSTALLWICRKAFFGKIPFPVIHIDTNFKFKEIIDFRDKYAKKWELDLIIAQNKPALANGMSSQKSILTCCTALKTDPLKQTISQYNLKAVLLGIRRDEHGIRAKERYFSVRTDNFQWQYENQSPEFWNLFSTSLKTGEHLRIHPLLHWSELNVWEYILQENIPVVDLYFSKNGKRYRSIGCAPCCTPTPSKADNVRKIIKELKETKLSERDGRKHDKEDPYTMQKLRSLGYM